MALGTNTDLQTTIANYLARSDLTAYIPDFIALAEAKMNRNLKCVEMEQRSTTTVDINGGTPQYLQLPADFQSMRRIRITSIAGSPRLTYLPSEMMDEKRFTAQDATGQPWYFSIFGSEIEFFPTPDQAYPIEMIYRKLLPSLSSNTSNWLLTNHPDAYLYGALLEAEPFMKNDQRIPVWAGLHRQVIDDINAVSADTQFNAGPLQAMVSGVATP